MSGASRPMRISELIDKLPAWCRRAGLSGDNRSSEASRPGPEPLDPATLPIPAALQGKISSVVKEADTLIISVSNSAAAQIMRFHGPRLASAAGLGNWRVRVASRTAARSGASAASGPAPALPGEAAPMLEALAKSCDHDKLSQALNRLAAQAHPDK